MTHLIMKYSPSSRDILFGPNIVLDNIFQTATFCQRGNQFHFPSSAFVNQVLHPVPINS